MKDEHIMDCLRIVYQQDQFLAEQAQIELRELKKEQTNKVCPTCSDRGWIYDDEAGTRNVCPCHY